MAIKYEVYYLMTKSDFVNEKLDELQNEGWEIVGDILTKNESGWCGDTYLHIPMKRITSGYCKHERTIPSATYKGHTQCIMCGEIIEHIK